MNKQLNSKIKRRGCTNNGHVRAKQTIHLVLGVKTPTFRNADFRCRSRSSPSCNLCVFLNLICGRKSAESQPKWPSSTTRLHRWFHFPGALNISTKLLISFPRSVKSFLIWSLCHRGIWNASVMSSINCSKLAALRRLSKREIRLKGRDCVGNTTVTTRGFKGESFWSKFFWLLPEMSFRSPGWVGRTRFCCRCRLGSKCARWEPPSRGSTAFREWFEIVFRILKNAGLAWGFTVKMIPLWLWLYPNQIALVECVPRRTVCWHC